MDKDYENEMYINDYENLEFAVTKIDERDSAPKRKLSKPRNVLKKEMQNLSQEKLVESYGNAYDDTKVPAQKPKVCT